MSSALKRQKIHVLITNVGTYLGAALASSYLDQNCAVFGISSTNLPQNLLQHQDFTLLDIDLSQPFPSHLPTFDIIFHLDPALQYSATHFTGHLPQTSNIISHAQNMGSRLFVFAPITLDPETINIGKNSTLFLIGDVYGPGINTNHPQDEIQSLISQAAKNDKIILENEGLAPIYPAYIKDVIFAVNKVVFSQDQKRVCYLISDPVQTALTVSYEIQSVLAQVADKDLGLFFSGPPAHQRQPAQIDLGPGDLDFSPKFHLKEGLIATFQYLAENNQIETAYRSHRPTITDSQAQVKLEHEPEAVQKLSGFHKFGPNINPRKVLAVATILLIATFVKTGLDLFLANSALIKAQSSISAGQLQAAAASTQSAKNSFQAIKNKVTILMFPISPILPAQTTAVGHTLDALIVGTSALSSTIEATQQLTYDLSTIILPEAKNDGADQDNAVANFRKAYSDASRASQLLKNSKVQMPIFRGKLEEALQTFERISRLSQSAFEIANLLDELTGNGSVKTYLVLLENNTELRPGGGFIGNFALLEFDGGKLKNITVEDIYTIDGQLQEEIEPPVQLTERLGVTRLFLRDSNWSPDFKINALTARDLFKKETAKNVDGTIAVDLTFVQNILAIIGPVTLADYNEVISADNLFERGEYHSEIGSFPGSTQKRDFFGALTRALINKIVSSLPSPATSNQQPATSSTPWLDLLTETKKALEQKHLLMTFDNQNLASYVTLHGWDSPMPPKSFNPADDIGATRDFLAISEANLGANKVNRQIMREIFYEMTVGRDADLVGKLTISYANESQAETWPAGKYVNYLRVYVPFASGLLEVNNGGNTDAALVEVTNQGNLTTFATYVEVPIKSTREITFTYRIPKNIKLESTPNYHLYVAKQPGTDRDPFTFTFNLPAYLAVKSVNNDQKYEGGQNITLDTDLLTDRQFEIEVVKK